MTDNVAGGGDAAGMNIRRYLPQRRTLISLAGLVIVLCLWAVVTMGLKLVSPVRFPSPLDTWSAARQLIFTGYGGGLLWEQVWHSSRLVLLGFAVAASSGVALGIIMGISRRAQLFINPTFLLLRPIPPLAWIPLAILWFGLGDTSKIFVIWYAAFVPCVLNTLAGIRTVDKTLIAAARVHGASPGRVLREVQLPGALPMVFTGLRLSLQACWTTLVAAELVGAFFGIGRVLVIAGQDIYPGMILVAMLCVAALGAGMTKVLTVIEQRLLAWRFA
ncbi:ABC transporter permease [Paracoccus aerius]|uniref:ABC transporter permease n=1 Tax=Paracoccus aerius TaxID=1915382 RepID=A0ABS1SB47_9RHOB|nr:ABC transporter permease [Paracoccus aerius]MBL3675765.1 ABC transporter permease [Paracoccus aerius]